MHTGSQLSDRDTSQLSDPLSDLDSLYDADSPVQQTEWLATTRKRRSTAGNRMKSMLANEEPDSDLELLFAEDENDQGFSDVGEDGSDVQMDSSSDDEDDNNANADDLEGEKELERQAKSKRAAQRKRKAQEAIPAKFRKKVRIDPTTTTSPAPAHRPKKKSERTSWLPSAADLPTRASSRKTTLISKEQLHLQMAEREARRLKQLAQMKKKAARLEAMKKPPMTQEERLAEAAIVEKRNSKSLNRWEEAEKQREEERKAKLAALNQRTLQGPVITFWSGKGQWEDLELRPLRPYVTEVEEKPKKKREKADKGVGKTKGKNKDNDKAKDSQEKNIITTESLQIEAAKDFPSGIPKSEAPEASRSIIEAKPSSAATTDDTTQGTDLAAGAQLAETKRHSDSIQPTTAPAFSGAVAPTNISATESRGSAEARESRAESCKPEPTLENPQEKETVSKQPLQPTASTVTAIDIVSRNSDASGSMHKLSPDAATFSASTASVLTTMPNGLAAPQRSSPPIPPTQTSSPLAVPSGLSTPQKPRPSGVFAAPLLAPPAGMSMVRSDSDAPKSNILARPAISLSEPSQVLQPKSLVALEVAEPMDVDPKSEAPVVNAQLHLNETTPTSKGASPRDFEAPGAPEASLEPPRDKDATRNGIIFQNFNETALRDKTILTQILFGRKMTKLARPAAPPICVITNNPACYRDPKTGLPFYNIFAYKELQRLYQGDYNWSRLIGAWVGSGKQAAKGVPERFTNPDSGKPKTPTTTDSTPTERDPQTKKDEGSGQSSVPAVVSSIASSIAPGAKPVQQNAPSAQPITLGTA